MASITAKGLGCPDARLNRCTESARAMSSESHEVRVDRVDEQGGGGEEDGRVDHVILDGHAPRS